MNQEVCGVYHLSNGKGRVGNWLSAPTHKAFIQLCIQSLLVILYKRKFFPQSELYLCGVTTKYTGNILNHSSYLKINIENTHFEASKRNQSNNSNPSALGYIHNLHSSIVNKGLEKSLAFDNSIGKLSRSSGAFKENYRAVEECFICSNADCKCDNPSFNSIAHRAILDAQDELIGFNKALFEPLIVKFVTPEGAYISGEYNLNTLNLLHDECDDESDGDISENEMDPEPEQYGKRTFQTFQKYASQASNNYPALPRNRTEKFGSFEKFQDSEFSNLFKIIDWSSKNCMLISSASPIEIVIGGFVVIPVKDEGIYQLAEVMDVCGLVTTNKLKIQKQKLIHKSSEYTSTPNSKVLLRYLVASAPSVGKTTSFRPEYRQIFSFLEINIPCISVPKLYIEMSSLKRYFIKDAFLDEFSEKFHQLQGVKKGKGKKCYKILPRLFCESDIADS